jgi:integration host factor subunit beta
MNKSGLIDALSTKENLTEKNASEIINLVFDGFTHSLMEGERIEIRGFGSFTVREYGAYMGKNPKTGDKTEVGAKKLPFFKVGKELKGMVNGSRR